MTIGQTPNYAICFTKTETGGIQIDQAPTMAPLATCLLIVFITFFIQKGNRLSQKILEIIYILLEKWILIKYFLISAFFFYFVALLQFEGYN